MRPTQSAYAVAAVVTSVGTLLRDERVHAAAKYAIAPLAALDVAIRRDAWAAENRTRTTALLAALTGSAVGDHVMLAESRADDPANADAAMRRGASAFAVQQVGFLALMATRGQRFRRGPATACAATLASLAVIDAWVAHRDSDAAATKSNGSESLASPLPDPIVAGYGVLLASMAALAQDDVRTTWGGRVFLASDAVIVARRLLPHGPARRAADAVVMATYTAALKLLVDGLADD